MEIGGPQRFSLSELLQTYLAKTNNPLQVISDQKALYFGSPLEELTLVPAAAAKLGSITFEQWFPNRPIRA